jgi:hypothetical protein
MFIASAIRRTPLWSGGQSSCLQNGDVLFPVRYELNIYICNVEESRPLLLSSGQSSWLQMYCVSCEVRTEFMCYVEESIPPLWSGGQTSWLQVRVRFPALPHFLRSNGSGTGSTQSREYN